MCGETTWIKKEQEGSTITPLEGNTELAYFIDTSGLVMYDIPSSSFDHTPVVYLTENIKYITGTGTIIDPILINNI